MFVPVCVSSHLSLGRNLLAQHVASLPPCCASSDGQIALLVTKCLAYRFAEHESAETPKSNEHEETGCFPTQLLPW